MSIVSPSLVDWAQATAAELYAPAIELLQQLARIPAPSHHEEQRAAYIQAWLHDAGLTRAYVDDATNVICPLAHPEARDLVVFAAHTDVVFDDTSELPLHEEGGRLYAPGVGDDTANLVALLMATRHLHQHPELLPKDVGILVVANSCEEGLGNLKGTRQLFDTYGSRVRRFYSFDLYLPGIVSTAVGSHRWQISVHTQGGHSFKDFGRPNAIERLCALIQELYALPLPQNVPCTMNVGSISGGTTVNSIASEASCLFEYRSTADEALEELRTQLQEAVAHYASDNVQVQLTSVGERPASAGARSGELERMTELTRQIMHAVTGQEPLEAPASTDANIPLSLGIPANTVGAVRGALLHTRDEWIDAASVREGLAVVLALMTVQGR